MSANRKAKQGGIMKITSTGKRLAFKPISAPQLRAIGAKAVGLRVAGVTQSHTGSHGGPMMPYSKRGPIYVPITGRGRTKTSLGGRQVLTAADLRAARKLGRNATQTPSRKSAKFSVAWLQAEFRSIESPGPLTPQRSNQSQFALSFRASSDWSCSDA